MTLDTVKETWLNLRTGAFVAAPFGAILWGFVAFASRVTVQWILAKGRGQRFEAFDHSPPLNTRLCTDRGDSREEEQQPAFIAEPQNGKFF